MFESQIRVEVIMSLGMPHGRDPYLRADQRQGLLNEDHEREGPFVDKDLQLLVIGDSSRRDSAGPLLPDADPEIGRAHV